MLTLEAKNYAKPRYWEQGQRDTTVHEFVSFSAPVSEHDTLTRNGDYLRTWRLGGVTFEGVDEQRVRARHEALCNLLRNLPEGRCVAYQHRIQRRASDRLIDPVEPHFSAAFSRAYQDKLEQQSYLLKEFYLTLLYRPFENERDRRMAKATRTAASQERWIKDAIERMTDLSNLVETTLVEFDPVPLGVRHEDGVDRWEAGEFYSFLINGIWDRMPLPDGPAWRVLPRARLNFGGSELEIRALEGRRYATMLDIKEYPAQVDPGSLSPLLYVDSEYIETQCLALMPRRQAMAALRVQRDQLIASDDVVHTQITAMDDAMNALGDGQITMGEYSYTLAVFGDSPAEARRRATQAAASVARLNATQLVPVELLADGAWFSQQPGNLQFRTRKASISSRAFAALACCHTFPLGKRDGNPWGQALAIMRTPAGHPFYFNLHVSSATDDDEGKKLPGNTIFIGQTGSGKTTLLTALMALTPKWAQPPRIISFSLDRDTEIVIRALGGSFHRFEYGRPTGLNPLQRPMTEARVGHWCALVRKCIEAPQLPLLPSEIQAIEDAVRALGKLEVHERSFTSLQYLLPRDGENSLFQRLQRWTAHGELGWVFDGGPDSIGEVTRHRYLGFDYTGILAADEVRVPVMMDLLSIVEELVDGTPMIYHVAECWKALGDPVFAKFVKHGQKTIRKKNGLGLFDTQEVADLLENENGRTMIEQSVTKVFLPNKDADQAEYMKAGLSETEFDLVRRLGADGTRQFLVKQNGSSTLCEFDLGGLDNELAVLSTTLDNVQLLDQVRADVGDDPAVWLPVFYQRVRDARTRNRRAA
ncbi:MAG: VirB4 family type IV secretion/conjugal transfer ATPase [Rhodocyclales bacterium]|nr:VirB4 family type IV secretion/conjugal transfer ATPase [Rhodocyclales bacterium]